MCIREERRVLINQHKWKEAEAHFLISLPVILDRVKHGQEKWISRLWLRLRVQWNTTNTKTMAQAMAKVIAQPQSSILYSLISFSNSTVYNGMVQERPGTARMTEHATATSDKHPIELKYREMRAAGGGAAWHFIPIVAGAAVPRRQLITTAGTKQERTTGKTYESSGHTDTEQRSQQRRYNESRSFGILHCEWW